MAKTTTETATNGTDVQATETKKRMSRSEWEATKAERLMKREAASAAKLAARIALCDDARLIAKAFHKGYGAALADVPADANPFTGRIQNFADAWDRGHAQAVADLQR
jgi:hypothetical protein